MSAHLPPTLVDGHAIRLCHHCRKTYLDTQLGHDIHKILHQHEPSPGRPRKTDQ